MSRSVTMCHYMKTVKRSKISKRGILKTAKVTLNDINHRSSVHLRSPLGLFGLLPREMRFRVFGFTPLADLGQLSLASRIFTDEVMRYLHNNDALLVIVPNVHLNIDEECSQVFMTLRTEYCWNHFKDLGKNYENQCENMYCWFFLILFNKFLPFIWLSDVFLGWNKVIKICSFEINQS